MKKNIRGTKAQWTTPNYTTMHISAAVSLPISSGCTKSNPSKVTCNILFVIHNPPFPKIHENAPTTFKVIPFTSRHTYKQTQVKPLPQNRQWYENCSICCKNNVKKTLGHHLMQHID